MVRLVLTDYKIRRCVVRSIAVDMVDLNTTWQRLSDGLLNAENMLPNVKATAGSCPRMPWRINQDVAMQMGDATFPTQRVFATSEISHSGGSL